MAESGIDSSVATATEAVASAVARLAELSPAEYEQCRKDERKVLGVRQKYLDDEVERARKAKGLSRSE